MNVVVFSGPSLSPRQARTLFPEAECLGPAAQGDIFAVCERGPQLVCLIDGVFEHRPAVTHKEILWALHGGSIVYGAASMGALRAVELAEYGMLGWGAVFARFARGELEDDDEVAVAHADVEHDYQVGSDALVNIRATLARAEREQIASPATCEKLIAAAKSLFYPERRLDRLLFFVRELAHDREERERLSAWLKERANWVDEKRADAESLLTRVRELWREGGVVSARRDWSFPYTSAWHELVAAARTDPTPFAQRARARGEPSAPMRAAELPLVIEELQLLGSEVFADIMLSSTWRALALALARAEGVPVEASDEDTLVAGMEERTRALALAQVPKVLRLLGDDAKVLERARRKQTRVGAASDPDPGARAGLLAWYFAQRLGRPVPEQLEAYAASVGMPSARRLLQAIAREHAFVHGTSPNSSGL